MSQDTPNPFALPGMSAAFMNTPNNPLLTSMDMMRQAMGSMGYGAKSSSPESMVNPMAPEELEKRISDLRTVENWLKLNLSMLSSTIQGMEVQLATVKTLQSFVALGQSSGATSATEASPLEIALGLKTAPYKPKAPPKVEAEDKASDPSPASTNASDPQQAAALDWWKMLEGQFAQIAVATANAAKAGNEALQKTAAKSSTRGASTRQAPTTKPRVTKRAGSTSRTPKREV